MNDFKWHEEYYEPPEGKAKASDWVPEQIKQVPVVYPEVYSRSFGLKGKAVEANDHDMFLVEFDPSTRWWVPRDDLDPVPPRVTLDEILIRNFVESETSKTFMIDEPKGLFPMAKMVKLVVGEGDDKVEVGTASVEQLPSGQAAVQLTITNAALIKVLGGNEVRGIIPSFVEAEEQENTDGVG